MKHPDEKKLYHLPVERLAFDSISSCSAFNSIEKKKHENNDFNQSAKKEEKRSSVKLTEAEAGERGRILVRIRMARPFLFITILFLVTYKNQICFLSRWIFSHQTEEIPGNTKTTTSLVMDH